MKNNMELELLKIHEALASLSKQDLVLIDLIKDLLEIVKSK